MEHPWLSSLQTRQSRKHRKGNCIRRAGPASQARAQRPCQPSAGRWPEFHLESSPCPLHQKQDTQVGVSWTGRDVKTENTAPRPRWAHSHGGASVQTEQGRCGRGEHPGEGSEAQHGLHRPRVSFTPS